MKPFNLEAFKAGAAAVTRGGQAAYFVAFVPELEEHSRLLARIEGHERIRDFNPMGAHLTGGSESEHDLLMAPVKQTVYVQIFNEPLDVSVPSLRAVAFINEKDAANNVRTTSWKVLGTFPIEIEA